MWRADASRECVLVLGSHHLEWGVGSRKGRAYVWHSQVHMAYEGETSSAALCIAIADLANALGEQMDSADTVGLPLRVLVSDRWLVLTDVPWNPQLVETASAIGHLRMMMQQSGFDLDPEDVISFDAPSWGERASVVAWPAELSRALQAFSARQKLRFVSLLPLLVAVGANLKTASSALAVVESGWVRFYARAPNLGGHLRPLGERLPYCSFAQIKTYAKRVQLRFPFVQQPIHCVVLEEKSLPADDEGMVWESLAAHGWPLLALASDVWPKLAAHGLDAGPMLPATTPRQAKVLAGLVGAVALLLMAQLLSHTPPPLPRRNQVEPRVSELVAPRRVAAVAGAVVMLNLPVDALMRQLVSPQDIEALPLSIELSHEVAGRDDEGEVVVKIVMESPSADEMSRYITFLSNQPKISRIQLLRHEFSESNPSAPYVFQLELRWQA